MTEDPGRRPLSPEEADRVRRALKDSGDTADPAAPRDLTETLCRGDHDASGEVDVGRLGIPGVTVTRVVGRGGMGVVLEATQTKPVRRRVAVKLVAPGRSGPDFARRFREEQSLLAGVEHPNVARLYDAGTTAAGEPYFLMEYVEGRPLAAFCEEQSLDLRRRIELMIDVCRAVQFLHTRQVVHRDLKPDNVLVTRVGGDAVPKVIDFGLAKLVGGDRPGRTAVGSPVGTLRYMSPEQTGRVAELPESEPVDAASDVFALGAMLFELIAGDTPVSRDSQADVDELLRQIAETDPPPVSEAVAARPASHARSLGQSESALRRECRRDLDYVVAKALKRSKRDRYRTADALADDLQAYLDNRPVAARPPSRRYAAGKFVRRNAGGVLAASLLVLSLVGGLVGTGLGLSRARTAEREALAAQAVAEETAERERAALRRAETSLDVAVEKADSLQVAVDAFRGVFLSVAESAGPGSDRPDDAAVAEALRSGLADVLPHLRSVVEEAGDAPELASLMSSLALAFGAVGEPAGKGELFDLLERSERRFVTDDPTTSVLHALTLSVMASREERRADAERLLLTAEARLERLPSPPSRLLAVAKHVRAQLNRAAGDYEAALALRREVAEELDPADPAFRDLYYMNLANIGGLLYLSGRYEESLSPLRRAVIEWTAGKPAEASLLLTARTTLALSLRRLGRDEAYVETMRSARDAYRRAGRGGEPLAEAELNYATSLLNTGRPRQAREAAEAGLREDTSRTLNLELRYLVAEAREAVGDPLPEAEKAELHAALRSGLPPSHPARVAVTPAE